MIWIRIVRTEAPLRCLLDMTWTRTLFSTQSDRRKATSFACTSDRQSLRNEKAFVCLALFRFYSRRATRVSHRIGRSGDNFECTTNPREDKGDRDNWQRNQRWINYRLLFEFVCTTSESVENHVLRGGYTMIQKFTKWLTRTMFSVVDQDDDDDDDFVVFVFIRLDKMRCVLFSKQIAFLFETITLWCKLCGRTLDHWREFMICFSNMFHFALTFFFCGQFDWLVYRRFRCDLSD